MKVAVVGCGAVGSYYGGKLCHAGHEVHFLLRSDYEVVRKNGVLIASPEGETRVFPRAATEPEQIGECDLVLVALKTTANHRFADLIPPLVGKNTRILTLQNGLGNEEQLASLFRSSVILGGLCFVCLNRVAPGIIRHFAYGDVTLGQHGAVADEQTLEIAEQLSRAGIRVHVTENLARARWEKLVWNVPFNGLGVGGVVGRENLLAGIVPKADAWGPTLTTDKLLADSQWLALVRELMMEVIAAANTFGLGVSEALPDEMIARTRTMGAYKASTLLDFERGLPIELEQIFLEPLRRASVVGVAMP
ncbi:MAG: 2-dehydropantoate 2-reductase, partial [Verrucomicrobiae bacterium]|nr:2-dehydropantoate 2-reductase [Verrucomicrobiae bacterium]